MHCVYLLINVLYRVKLLCLKSQPWLHRKHNYLGNSSSIPEWASQRNGELCIREVKRTYKRSERHNLSPPVFAVQPQKFPLPSIIGSCCKSECLWSGQSCLRLQTPMDSYAISEINGQQVQSLLKRRKSILVWQGFAYSSQKGFCCPGHGFRKNPSVGGRNGKLKDWNLKLPTENQTQGVHLWRMLCCQPTQRSGRLG